MKFVEFKTKILIIPAIAIIFLMVAFSLPPTTSADASVTTTNEILAPTRILAYSPCGAGSATGSSPTAYMPAIDIGCENKGNPISDSLFAIIRFLSDGVGLVVIGSIIVGGIQYSASQGDPKATAQAVHRLRSAITALLIYIFGYAILNYIIPAGFLH